jgi:hypothetical protein
MRRTFLGIALLAAPLGALSGCAENPPPVTPAPAPEPSAVAPAPPPIDLSPVAEPADVFVLARWKNPNATLTGISGCAGVPGQLAETSARQLVNKALANAFRGGVDGRQIADAVALDAPLDLAVSLDTGRRGQPQALFAFSVPLTSLDRVKTTLTAAGPLVELVPGLWRVGVKDEGDLTCVIGPAAGAAPARLICGQHDKDVMTLGPYLARNVPVAAPPAQDLHAELRFAPVDARYGADLRRYLGFLPSVARSQGIGEPRFDQALDEAANALAGEGAALMSDLDRISFDLGVDAVIDGGSPGAAPGSAPKPPGTCLVATTTLELKGQSSWLAGTIAEGGAQAGPPPAIFWRAPRDADSTSYGRASDVSRYSGIFRVLRGLVEGKLAQEKIGSEADRKALAALLASPFHKGTNMVIASGHPRGAPPPPAGDATPQQLVDDLMSGYLGWSLVGVDEGPEALTKLLKDAVAVYGKKSLLDPVRKLLGNDAEYLPAAKLGPGPAALGKGSLDLELKFQIEKKKSVRFSLHALLMADGKGTTWVAFGADRDELVKHLLAVKSGAPDAGTLASRPGLEPLRSTAAVGSGFVTLATLTRSLSSLARTPASSRSAQLADLAAALNGMPHHGETPIFVTTKVLPGAGPRAEVALQMQKGTFEDLGSVVLAALRIAQSSGLKVPAP